MLAVFETPEFLEEGGLMSFGADFPELFRSSAYYVARILEGVHPQELPIQQPTKFSLIINARVARERGVELPASLLVRADQVLDAN
jgi:putative tryptophan/tyrosine transport system substrate-binding protein